MASNSCEQSTNNNIQLSSRGTKQVFLRWLQETRKPYFYITFRGTSRIRVVWTEDESGTLCQLITDHFLSYIQGFLRWLDTWHCCCRNIFLVGHGLMRDGGCYFDPTLQGSKQYGVSIPWSFNEVNDTEYQCLKISRLWFRLLLL